jgi:hypothetical protein
MGFCVRKSVDTSLCPPGPILTMPVRIGPEIVRIWSRSVASEVV